MFIETFKTNPTLFFSIVFAVVLSIVIHELAHGWTALRFGDPTPRLTGHMTANPLVHMGPVSIILLLVTGIAFGRMPIDRSRLRGRFAEAAVAAAGPLSNLLLAAVALTGLALWVRYVSPDPVGEMFRPMFQSVSPHPLPENFRDFVQVFGKINLVLCAFNLLPAPPLDGSHILANFSRGYRNVINQPSNHGLIMFLLAIAVLASIQVVPWLNSLGSHYIFWVANIHTF